MSTELEQLEGSPTEFRVAIKNVCQYPVRVPLWFDEVTGAVRYNVFKQFERREVTINLLTFQYLQREPRIRLTRINE